MTSPENAWAWWWTLDISVSCRSHCRTAQLSLHDRERQRHRADLERDLALATRPRCRMALHCPPQRASTGSHGLSSQHAPIRGISGTDTPYKRGQVGEQVKKKQAGEKIEVPRERAPAKVINLIDALRRSVEASRGSGKREA